MSKKCLSQGLVKPRPWVNVLYMKSSELNNCFLDCLLLPPDKWTSDSLRRLSTPEGKLPDPYFLHSPSNFQIPPRHHLCPQLEFHNSGRASLSHPPLVTQALTFLLPLLSLPPSATMASFLVSEVNQGISPIPLTHMHWWALCLSWMEILLPLMSNW